MRQSVLRVPARREEACSWGWGWVSVALFVVYLLWFPLGATERKWKGRAPVLTVNMKNNTHSAKPFANTSTHIKRHSLTRSSHPGWAYLSFTNQFMTLINHECIWHLGPIPVRPLHPPTLCGGSLGGGGINMSAGFETHSLFSDGNRSIHQRDVQ